MERVWVFVIAFVALLGFSGSANADLFQIGTAQFDGDNSEYNLFYEEYADEPGLVWLDFTNAMDTWDNQVSWASGLELSINTEAYYVSWNSNWRLASAGEDPGGDLWYETSEFGHLLITLETMYQDKDGEYYGEEFPSPFENVLQQPYWSSTENDSDDTQAWAAYPDSHVSHPKTDSLVAGPVRRAEVSPVPVPSALLLLGSGLIGLVGCRRKMLFKKN